MKRTKRIAVLAIAGMIAFSASAPAFADRPDTKGCPGFTQGNNLYWPHFWVLDLLLGSGIIPGQWITGESGCLD